MQAGFYVNNAPTIRIHQHNYTEVHLVTGGDACFQIGDMTYQVKSGDMLVIPKRTFHCCVGLEQEARHTAFQIDYEVKRVVSYHCSADTILNFLQEIKNCGISGDYAKVSAFLTLFCSYFCDSEKLSVQPITDYGFLISEFFSNRYSEDIKLGDLAGTLHLSERQAERLVIELMGCTFREKLVATRLAMAGELMKTTEMSLGEIAQYVGYQSYAGFWKAMRRNQKDNNV